MMKNWMLIFIVFFSLHGAVHAQERINGFTDYESLEKGLTGSIQEAVKARPFTTMQQLRQRVQLVSDTARAGYSPVIGSNAEMLPTNMVTQRKPAVLALAKYMSADSLQPSGTIMWASAIVLTADGICASNYHVFYDMLNKVAWQNNRDSLLFAFNSDGELFSIDSILSYNQKADAVLFKINTHGKKLTPMPVANKDVEVGEHVYAFTNPYGFLFYFSSGIVARKSAVVADGPWGNRVEITAEFARGSSGGPILDSHGNLVAMVSATNAVYSRDSPGYGTLQMVVRKTIPLSSILMLANYRP